MPRRHEGAAAGAEHLQIDVVVARIDRRHHRQRVVGGDEGRGEGRERRQADRRLAGGERDAARRGDADAQAGEAAGSGGDRDAVEIGEVEPPRAAITRAISGISASAWPRAIGIDSCAATAPRAGVEHGGRAGLERGIDGKDAHEQPSSPASR